jgi:DNA-binding MarR family transcriptional regulator
MNLPKTKVELNPTIELGSRVTVNYAGTKVQGQVVQINKDRTSAQVFKKGMRPIWYKAEFIQPAKPQEHINADKRKKPKENVEKEKPAVKEIVGDVKEETVDLEGMQLTKLQAQTLEEIKHGEIEARELCDKLLLTKIQLVPIGEALIEMGLINMRIEEGQYFYIATPKGKKVNTTVYKSSKKSNNVKARIIDMIQSGAKNKEIVAATGCNPSYPWMIKTELKVLNAHVENPDQTNEEMVKNIKVSIQNILLYRPGAKK